MTQRRQCVNQPLRTCIEGCFFAQRGTSDRFTKRAGLTEERVDEISGKLKSPNAGKFFEGMVEANALQKLAAEIAAGELGLNENTAKIMIKTFCELEKGKER